MKTLLSGFVSALIFWPVLSVAGEFEAPPLVIGHTITVEVPLTRAWEIWTTKEGLETFLAEEIILERQVNGHFQVNFFPENPQGQKGTEDLTILVLEPEKRFAFSWDAPPWHPEIRQQRTFVEVVFFAAGAATTTLTLRQMGWGSDGDWPVVRDYFIGAWKIILERFEYRLENGPIDWSNVPDHLWHKADTE
jgi:uncharacterized protein YndB with AHSA1/START domain